MIGRKGISTMAIKDNAKKLDIEDLKSVSGGNLDDYFRYVNELKQKYNVENDYELGNYLTKEEWEQLRVEVFK